MSGSARPPREHGCSLGRVRRVPRGCSNAKAYCKSKDDCALHHQYLPGFEMTHLRSSDSHFGHGHSVHAAGGRGSKKTQMRRCIRVLRSMTSPGEETINQDLCDQGTINQLLGILMQMEAGPDDDDVIALEIKSGIQAILSTLCETDMHRKELFGSEGVEMAVHFLRKGSDKFYSGLGHNKLLLSTVASLMPCSASPSVGMMFSAVS